MARMSLFEFTHKLKKKILQGELETHAKSMNLICKSQNQKIITHWDVVFAIIPNLGTKSIRNGLILFKSTKLNLSNLVGP